MEAEKTNDEHAARYTYIQDTTYYSYDKKGIAKKDHTETSEVIFVEGETYKRLVARDGKPLSPKEQAKEEKKMRQTAEERRKARRNSLFNRTVRFGTKDLAELFDSRVLGEEEIRGRKAWIIECNPQPGRVLKNQHEKDVLVTQSKIWVDQAEHEIVKWNLSFIAEGSVIKPGSIAEFEYKKVNDDAWLQISGISDLRLQIAKFIRAQQRSEYRNSNFQKFDVESTITVDEIKP